MPFHYYFFLTLTQKEPNTKNKINPKYKTDGIIKRSEEG